MRRESGRSFLHHLSVILAAAGMMLCLFGIVTVGSVDANETGQHERWNRYSSPFKARGALRATSVPLSATRPSGTTIAAISSRKSPESMNTAGDGFDSLGFGFQLQQAVGRHTQLRFEAFYTVNEHHDDGAAARAEVLVVC